MPYKHSNVIQTVLGKMSPKKGEPLTQVSHTGVYQPVVCPNYTVKKTKSRFKLSSAVCLVLLLLSMAFNGALIGYLVYHHVTSDNDVYTGHHDVTTNTDLANSICVSCDSMHVHDPALAPLLPEVKVIEIDSKSKMCCLRHTEHLQTLLNLVVGEYYHYSHGGNMSDDFKLSPTTPAAHLYLKRDRESTNSKRLLWDDDTGYGTAHVTGGVVYENGSLHVPQDGVYFLYSHVTISSVHTDSDLDLIHCVERYNPHLPGMGKHLLMISKTSLGVDTKKTSYLGANLKLRRDDQIFVEFSNQSLIYNFPPANFFGLHLL